MERFSSKFFTVYFISTTQIGNKLMQCFLFHLMPYASLDLDYDKDYKASWVIYPNSNFDPKVGSYLYNTYLDELELGEELGFDGLCVNEHHQNAYGLMPSPIVPAAALARRRTPSLLPLRWSFCSP